MWVVVPVGGVSRNGEKVQRCSPADLARVTALPRSTELPRETTSTFLSHLTSVRFSTCERDHTFFLRLLARHSVEGEKCPAQVPREKPTRVVVTVSHPHPRSWATHGVEKATATRGEAPPAPRSCGLLVYAGSLQGPLKTFASY